MATYYRWKRFNFKTTNNFDFNYGEPPATQIKNKIYYYDDFPTITENGYFNLTKNINSPTIENNRVNLSTPVYFGISSLTKTIYYVKSDSLLQFEYIDENNIYPGAASDSSIRYTISGSGEYVYHNSISQYPESGDSGSYYYILDKTPLISPTNPEELSYSSEIHSLLVNIFWQSATSNTSYPVSRYELSYSTNGGSSWQVAGTTEETSYQFGITPGVTQIQFRVRAMDTNSQYSDYVTGSNSTVQYVPANPPVLVLPDNAKLGDTITISWNSVTDATNYILQRKVDGGDWTQIYSGANLSTTNLVDNLGISYRIAFNVGSNFTSEWSQEYRLNTYEKLIEMTYLGDDGNYMPLYPRTISNAVVNASDLINTVSLSGTYQGNGFETNSIALENSVEPKVAIITNSKQETTLVTNFNKNNMTVKNSNNELGETYNYVIIGNNKSK